MRQSARNSWWYQNHNKLFIGQSIDTELCSLLTMRPTQREQTIGMNDSHVINPWGANNSPREQFAAAVCTRVWFARVGSFLRTSCSERFDMAIAEFREVENYLTRQLYPSGMTEGDGANFRRKCKRNYIQSRKRYPLLPKVHDTTCRCERAVENVPPQWQRPAFTLCISCLHITSYSSPVTMFVK